MKDTHLQTYRDTGHVTVPDVFTPDQMDAAIADAAAWAEAELSAMDDQQRDWYVDKNSAVAQQLRKLDNPVTHRDVFRSLASQPALVEMVETIIGKGVTVFFSQIFFKPPEGGGPKPVHQDNFYFGPDDEQGMLTAWIALDEATVENGCLHYGEGTHRGPVIEHVAPPGEPFNLQIPPEVAGQHPMTPAPVPRGGVSFHHGNTFHQSSANRSRTYRRAAAIHYLRNDVKSVKPALPYDEGLFVKIT